jgi:mono/diheme cytochrome c family protein
MTDRVSTAAAACRAVCLATIAAGIATAAAAAEPVASFDGDATRGAYFAAIMDCQGCHSGRLADGRIDAAAHLTGGTIGFELPGLGIFYPPNLSPDAATGLGAWSDAEIAAAIRQGIRPDGRILAPIMPWESYHVMTDADVADLVAYLRSLPAADHAVPGPLGTAETATAPYFTVVVPGAG